MVQPNQLKNNQFKFELDYIPNVIYHTQTAVIPSISLDKPKLSTPHVNIGLGGTKLEFDPLIIEFIVDRELTNYIELYNWMIKIATTNKNDTHDSSADLHLLSGNLANGITLRFNHVHPIAISELSFDSKTTDPELLICSATFDYSDFEFV